MDPVSEGVSRQTDHCIRNEETLLPFRLSLSLQCLLWEKFFSHDLVSRNGLPGEGRALARLDGPDLSLGVIGVAFRINPLLLPFDSLTEQLFVRF